MRPRGRLIEHKPRCRMNINREIRSVAVLQTHKKPKSEHFQIQLLYNETNTIEGEANLEEGSPEKIEREVLADEEQEGDLGRAIEFLTGNSGSPVRESRRRELRLGVKLEESEGAEGEGDGDGDQKLPAEAGGCVASR